MVYKSHMNNCISRYERTGEKWTCTEENQLLTELKRGISICEISKNHQRSQGAIHSRIKEIAYRLYISGIEFGSIQKATKVNKYDFDSYLRKRNALTNHLGISSSDKYSNDSSSMNLEIQQFKKELKEDVESLKTHLQQTIYSEVKTIKDQLSELNNKMDAIFEFEDV